MDGLFQKTTGILASCRRVHTSFSFLALFVLGSILFTSSPAVVSAKTATWTSLPYHVSFYDGIPICESMKRPLPDPRYELNCISEPLFASIYPPQKADLYYDYDWKAVAYIDGVIANVSYSANVINRDTSRTLSDGETVPIGTRLQVKLDSFDSPDISWAGTGGFNDSPYGQWGVTGPTMGAYLGDTGAVGTCLGLIHMYSSLQISKPTTAIDNTSDPGVLSCNPGNTDCTVIGAGAVGFRVRYGATSGSQYLGFNKSGNACYSVIQNTWYPAGDHVIPYVGQDPDKIYDSGCASSSTEAEAIACGNQANANKFTLSVPARSIDFSLNAGTPPPTVNVRFGS